MNAYTKLLQAVAELGEIETMPWAPRIFVTDTGWFDADEVPRLPRGARRYTLWMTHPAIPHGNNLPHVDITDLVNDFHNETN